MLSLIKNFLRPEKIDFIALIEQGALIIDVRSPQEFAMGHAKGTINIPLGEISNHLREIKEQNKPVITCCRSGARASSANALLQQAGIEVYNAGSWNTVDGLGQAKK